MTKVLTPIRRFHELMDSFLADLDSICPDRTEMKYYRSWLERVRKMNPRLVPETFVSYIKPHKEKLIDFDEDYFLNLPYDGNQGGNDYTMSQALDLKKIWQFGNIDEESKEHVRNYMLALLTLGEDIINTPTNPF